MITELMEKLSDGKLDEKTVKETTAVAFGGTGPRRIYLLCGTDIRY